jgi:hypothetical protein
MPPEEDGFPKKLPMTLRAGNLRIPATHGTRQMPGRPKLHVQQLARHAAPPISSHGQQPGDEVCRPSVRNGYPVPDPRCTPGGVNLSVTTEMLRNLEWRTRCIRNCQTSEAEKHVTYKWYGIQKPRTNSGDNQVCELDHLVPLELGGADGLGNIWPECGPTSTVLENRYFKIKDRVENYLADEVKAGRMPLDTAQRGIASDWTQFLPEANRYCAARGRC